MIIALGENQARRIAFNYANFMIPVCFGNSCNIFNCSFATGNIKQIDFVIILN